MEDISTGMEASGSMDAGQATGAQDAGSLNEGGNATKSAPQSKPEVTEELVEVALGSAKGKIPKAMAEAIKNFERGTHSKLRESAEKEKKLQAYESAFKDKGKLTKLLSEQGIDPYEFAEMTLAEKIAALEMSPEQKRLAEAEERLKRYEEAERLQKEEMERQEFTRREQEGMKSLDQEIGQAFKESGLPKDPFFIQKIAAEMLASEKRGNPLTAAQAAAKIKSWFSKSLRQVFESPELSPQALEELIGDSTLKKLREHNLKRVTGQAPQQEQSKRPGEQPASQPRKQPDRPVTEKEYRKWIQSLKS